MHATIHIDERELIQKVGPRNCSAYLGERTFYELAGYCARPVLTDGLLWQKALWKHEWVACADIPSPEFLLV